MSKRLVFSDSRRLLLYFRRQEEGRLVFGGRGSLGGDKISAKHLLKLYEAMRASFPALGDIGVDYAWAGLVDLTSDRHLRVHVPAPGLKIIIGFNGRGVAIAPAVGRAVASFLSSGSLQELPLPVSQLRPVPFHGLRLPAMALAVQWYRLRDWLGREPHDNVQFRPQAPYGPKTSSKVSRRARSRSGSVTGRPSSTSEVTPCSRMPQGTMPSKWERSGSRLIARPWSVTQRRTRTPMAAILSSRPPPRATQLPTRP